MAVLSFIDENGQEFEILALKGDPGYTPQKGVDYYTEAEKQELIAEIDTTMLGDIETALDGIIAIQESLIGGASV